MTNFTLERGAGPITLLRNHFRANRARLFHRHFAITAATTILDLGGWDGAHLRGLLQGTAAQPENCHVADIDPTALERAAKTQGYNTHLLDAGGKLPFGERAFDIVFCSSVLEHVTISKADIWRQRDGSMFRRESLVHQSAFATEIRRVGKGYFVQVPYRHFPIETHTWLPFFYYLPRPAQIDVITATNKFWLKRTSPDFYLPTAGEFASFFPDGGIVRETMAGLIPKSLIAIRRSS